MPKNYRDEFDSLHMWLLQELGAEPLELMAADLIDREAYVFINERKDEGHNPIKILDVCTLAAASILVMANQTLVPEKHRRAALKDTLNELSKRLLEDIEL